MDEETLKEIARNAIIDADEVRAMALIDEVLNVDAQLLSVLSEGFSEGNNHVGEQFEKGKVSLPELIYSSEVMKLVIEKLLHCAGILEQECSGKIVLATVEGDVHDIGKGIVATTLRMAGFEVVDLGREVPVESIIEAAEKNQADIIGTSALLTSTLIEQKKLEQELRQMGIRGKYKTMVGGAPCTARWAKKIGADAYSEDAIDAVRKAKELLDDE